MKYLFLIIIACILTGLLSCYIGNALSDMGSIVRQPTVFDEVLYELRMMRIAEQRENR